MRSRNLKAALAACAALALPLAAHAQETAAATKAIPFDTGTTAWMLTSSGLVLIMIPALGMFYGGLVRTKNVLGTMMHSFAAMAIIGVIWAICGYAMVFGKTHGFCGWSWDFLMLRGIDEGPNALYPINVNGEQFTIPHLAFCMFQGKFAIITPALIAGAFAERVKFKSYCVFIALWSLLVYNPLAHWVWGGGFLTGEAIDFAGGTVIHISAGVAGLVMALYLGCRCGYPKTAMHPNNLTMTLMGAGGLWVGWFGFNAGSAVSSGLQTAQALCVTQIAAATGALAWILIEGFHLKRATSLGFVSGVLAGLVVITPAAGHVGPGGAMVLGVAATMVCYLAIRLKEKLGYDDTLDVFGIHGVAGIVGAIGLAFFIRESMMAHSMGLQLWYQVKGVLVSIAYSGAITLALTFLVDKAIGFRLAKAEEQAGMDHTQHRESGYGLLELN